MLLAYTVICLGSFLSMTSVSAAAAARPTPGANDPHCAKFNILFTGLPPYHPEVLASGTVSGDEIAEKTNATLYEMAADGWNIKELLWGPEEGVAPLEKALSERFYHGIGVGWGVRGKGTLNGTIHFEDIMNTLRTKAPRSKMMFSYSPDSTVEAVQRAFPLNGCPDRPGKNYGLEVVCSACEQ